MKKLIALLLAVIMVLALAACGSKTEPTPASPGKTDQPAAPSTGKTDQPAAPSAGGEPAWKGKTLTIACAQLPESLIIQNIKNNTGTGVIMPALYSHIFDYNENEEVVPSIGLSYSWDDETHLRIKLRDDVYTATGIKITAEDVKYSYTIGKEGVNSSAYNMIDDVIVEDPTTAIVVLTGPNPTFVDGLKEESFAIVSKEGVEKDGGMDVACKKPIDCTTGPYKYYEWVDGQYITLQYNENYLDKDYVPSYEFIKYIPISDNASRCLAVQSGDADIACTLSLADTLAYNNAGDIKVSTFPTSLTTTLFFNCRDGIFTNEDLRKCLAYLVDWQELAEVIAGPGAKLNEASMPRSSIYFYDHETRVKDVAKGKELMAKAGYPDGFSFTIKTAMPQAHHTNAALLLQAQLAEYGIEVKVESLDLGIYFGSIDAGDYEAHMCNAAAQLTTHLAFYDDYKTRAANYGGPQLSDPYVTDLVAKARAEFDEAKRIEYIKKIQEYQIEHRVGYTITDEVGFGLYNSARVQNTSSEITTLKPQFVRPAA